MVDVSGRIAAAVRSEYEGSADSVLDMLRELDLPGPNSERIAAAILARGRGHDAAVLDACALALTDWRDVLMGTGLENGDWAEVLDSRFGPSYD